MNSSLQKRSALCNAPINRIVSGNCCPFAFLHEEKPLLTSTGNREGTKKEIGVYGRDTLNSCPWPKTVAGEYARAFLTPLIEKGTTLFIENIATDLRVLIAGDLVLPITINDAEYDNSYVCSPYSFFISYARQSLGVLGRRWIASSMDAFLHGLGRCFQKLQLNKVVTVNNWFFSTNLYPHIEVEQLQQVVAFLEQTFPDHAIVFRCIDAQMSPLCFEQLKEQGFEYIASRQIFFLDPRESSLFDSRIFTSDLKLWKQSGYEVVDAHSLKEEQLPRLLELYRGLYLEKYSTLNPQLTLSFLKLMLKEKLMHIKVLKKQEQIDGVIGFIEREGKMYCPLFGYDDALPKEIGLYRILSTVLMSEAKERGLLFHQSSGASTFKKIRKAESEIEYTAVRYRHLARKRWLPWQILKPIYNSVGIKYMQKY